MNSNIGQILIYVVFLFFMFRMLSGSGKRKKQREQMERQLVPGTIIETASGMRGVLCWIDGDTAVVDFSSDPEKSIRIKMAGQMIARIVGVKEEAPVNEEKSTDAASAEEVRSTEESSEEA